MPVAVWLKPSGSSLGSRLWLKAQGAVTKTAISHPTSCSCFLHVRAMSLFATSVAFELPVDERNKSLEFKPFMMMGDEGQGFLVPNCGQ
eukprot:3289609-Heterocapsa_arctica.AAC.1